MKRVLITGATGTVGMEVLRALQHHDHRLELCAGVRNSTSGHGELSKFNVERTEFDFTNDKTFLPALQGIDVLFLLRPPQITDVKNCFEPLIQWAKKLSVKYIVFLSVQGVEKSQIIPHHKIESLILESEIPYTFLRPAYFMQNFLDNLNDDLVQKQRIYLPAGKAKFTLIDVKDIGAVTARILMEPKKHDKKCYELTNEEIMTFGEMAAKLSIGLGRPISYISPNLLQYFWTKTREGFSTKFIFVMIMLHYLPRFQETPETTKHVENITGRKPRSFEGFILENEQKLK